ncbi:LuxR C-terminal-related transcriptional regulator [Sanguibacter sp. HDW7]|uniref:helix-turn-helix transcriptional regulator n=1 Tax=Sanguibacter sp. HDW7 TaxID=2714931 RepID=UPI00140B5F98|nr:LuxR C-terminal-related transcriptional regulator [Sanguibacter sp. HDW7]QIK82335.1 AAA family ATPase [Sanguibacter sp. HDW7]
MAQKLHSRVVDDVLTRVRTGGVVRLVGLPGSGKSFTLDKVVERLDEAGEGSLVFRANPGLADRPLAVLATAGIEVGGPVLSARVVADAVEQTTERLSRRAVLVVDDAERLDQASLGVLRTARARAGAPALLSTGPLTRHADRIFSTEAAQRVAVPTLRHDEVLAVMTSVLGGEVAQDAVARVAAKSGGLPGLVVAIVAEGVRRGVLARRGGAWSVVGDLWSPVLGDAVAVFTSLLDDEGFAALETLAVVGPQEVSVAAGLVTTEMLGHLEELGLVYVIAGPKAPVVAVFPMILGTYLESEAPAVRKAAILARLRASGDELPGRAGLSDPVAPGNLWTVDRRRAGAVLPQVIRREQDRRVVVTRRAWEADRTGTQALALLAALFDTEVDLGEMEDVVDGTDTRSGLELARLEVWRATAIAHIAGDVARAVESLERVREANPIFRGLLGAHIAYLQLMSGTMPDDSLFDVEPCDDPLNLEAANVVRGTVLVAQGRTSDAIALLTSFTPTSHHHRLVRDSSLCIALYLEGDTQGALELASRRLDDALDALDVAAIETFAYVVSLVLRMGARDDELQAHNATVLTLGAAANGHSQFLVGLLGIGAVDAADHGLQAYARSLAVRAREVSPGMGPFPGMSGELGLTFVESASTRPTPDLEASLVALFKDAVARGFTFLAVSLAAWIAELGGGSPVGPVLRGLLPQLQGEAGRLVAAYAIAIEEKDVETLQILEGPLATVGQMQYAVRAPLTAARLLRELGDAARGANLVQATWDGIHDDRVARGRLFAHYRQLVDLSVREREVAELVARSMSNSAIAEALVVSVRTVDSHVLSACRKIGVDNRDDLALAVRTWLAHH